MYHSKRSSSSKKYRNIKKRNSNSSGNSQNRSSSRFSRRRVISFDPSALIKEAVAEQTQTKSYVPKNKFADFQIANALKDNIVGRGFETPTPIQDQAIPHLLKGRDVIGLARTGTGKTAAFLIPLINKVYHQRSEKVLIMAPTRELALQTRAEFELFAKNMKIYSTLCIGGANIKHQISSLKRNPNFVIGTPGRLIDLAKQRKLNFNSFSNIVLDEVDQMLDMGFIHDMRYIVSRLSKKRHSLFFSATLPSKLDEIVQSFLTNPIKLTITDQQAPKNINQDIVKINGRSKVELLNNLLVQDGFDKVLIFGRTKHGLNKLQQKLDKRGHRAEVIHGNKSQNQRKNALRKFKQNQVNILLATDVASRGLDIDDVTHVINYDLPESREVYIHRIGRTGRANKTGTALSFVA